MGRIALRSIALAAAALCGRAMAGVTAVDSRVAFAPCRAPRGGRAPLRSDAGDVVASLDRRARPGGVSLGGAFRDQEDGGRRDIGEDSMRGWTDDGAVRKSDDRDDDDDEGRPPFLLGDASADSNRRRSFLLSAALASAAAPGVANAAFGGLLPFGRGKDSGGLLLNSREGASSVQAIVGTGGDAALSAERCLLRLLPVRNPVFLALQAEIERASVLKSKSGNDGEAIPDAAWRTASNAANNTLKLLDTKRDRLQPVFNQDLDSTEMQIRRAQRGEDLIEDLRAKIVELINATGGADARQEEKYPEFLAFQRNITAAFDAQRGALLALAGVGELLVDQFPYDVPDEGRFSFLPRLLGRAKVTFTLKRGSQMLGNVTIIADGFAAPITAGNFVDLCVRGFYTGLPIKAFQKRLGSPAALEDYEDTGTVSSALANLRSKFGVKVEQEEGQAKANVTSGSIISATLPVWGSFNEGFYDPLTAKLRRIPLEIVELDRSLPGGAKLLYAGGFTDSGAFSMGGSALVSSLVKRTPVLTFDIPGVVGMNHPDGYPNRGSSEFFVLPPSEITPEKTKVLDKQYAPFGYVVEGYNLLAELKPGDVVAATDVSEWGKLNLVKVRSTTFGEIIQGSGSANDDEEKAGDEKEGK